MASDEVGGDGSRAFWQEFDAAAAELRADPAAWAAEQHERQLWESALADGLT